MGRIIPFEKLEAARLRRRLDDPESWHPLDRNAMADPQSAVTLAMATKEDALFFTTFDPDNTGIKILRGNPRHQLLRSVFEESLQKYFVYKHTGNLRNMNERWYWAFPDRPQRAYFLTPAHVCRTHFMAVAVWNNEGVDFKTPDAEGHLPLYFIARYARDHLLIPAITQKFNLNANDSGRETTKEFGGHAQAFDAPLVRAIKFGNPYAVRGFCALDKRHIDMNARSTLGLTPLMVAVLEANNAIEKYNIGEKSRHEVSTRLWIVRKLATSWDVDATLKDPTGWTAMDYATHPMTEKALKAGLQRHDEKILRYQLDF